MTLREFGLVGFVTGIALALLGPEAGNLPPVNVGTLTALDQANIRALMQDDGGLIYAVDADDKRDGGLTVRVTQPPCAWRPMGAGPPCTRTDGSNPGDLNTMQPGGFLGPGCVPKSCVKYAGEPDDDAALKPRVGKRLGN